MDHQGGDNLRLVDQFVDLGKALYVDFWVFSFVHAVGRTDRRGEDIDARALHKLLRFFRRAQLSLILSNHDLVFNAADGAQLPLYGDAADRVAVVHDLFGQADIFLKTVLRGIDHDVRVTVVSGNFARLDILTVVQVQANWHRSLAGHAPVNACDHLHAIEFEGRQRGLHNHR